MSEQTDKRILDRIKLCKVEQKSYEIWLKRLTPVNFVLVGIGGVISLLAGMTLVTEGTLFTPTQAGWGVLLGTALTELHKRLKCESHQDECHKMKNQFAELQTQYEAIQLETDQKEKSNQLKSLENNLATIRAGRGAMPGRRAIEKAEKQLADN